MRQLGKDRLMEKLRADKKNRKKVVAQFVSQLTADEREELKQEFDRSEPK
jgi:hypothetical protein